jgi:hypothetical protein
MNHKNGLIRIEQVNYLKKSPAMASADDIKLIVPSVLRVWRSSVSHNHFRFITIDAVFGDMVKVPIDPAELHLPIPILPGFLAKRTMMQTAIYASPFAISS